MDKRKKIIRGGAWLAAVKILQQIVSFSVNAVLAIILSPEIFGIVAIVTVFNGFIAIFTNFGFGASVIQKRRVTKIQLSSLFWLDLATSFLTFVVIFSIAPLAASIYKNPDIIPLLRIISVNFLLVSFFSLNRKLLEKKLDFVFLATADISATLVSSIGGIVMALTNFGAYSLVFQYLFMSLAYLVIIRIRNNWFPLFKFNWASIKELVYFSFKYKGALMLNYFERNVDFLLLGKLYPVNIVGLYSFAYNIMYMPVKRISNAFGEVLFPSFSSVNEDMSKLRNYFTRTIGTVSIITFPLTVFIFFNAGFIIATVFGDKWHDAIVLVRILCFAGALLSIDFSLSLLPAINKAELSIYFGILRIVLLIIGIFAGSFFGIEGVAYGILTVKIVSTIINMLVINTKIKLTHTDFFRALKGPILSSLVLSALFFVIENTPDIPANKIALIAGEMLISAGVIYLFNKTEIVYFYRNIRTK